MCQHLVMSWHRRHMVTQSVNTGRWHWHWCHQDKWRINVKTGDALIYINIQHLSQICVKGSLHLKNISFPITIQKFYFRENQYAWSCPHRNFFRITKPYIFGSERGLRSADVVSVSVGQSPLCSPAPKDPPSTPEALKRRGELKGNLFRSQSTSSACCITWRAQLTLAQLDKWTVDMSMNTCAICVELTLFLRFFLLKTGTLYCLGCKKMWIPFHIP